MAKFLNPRIGILGKNTHQSEISVLRLSVVFFCNRLSLPEPQIAQGNYIYLKV